MTNPDTRNVPHRGPAFLWQRYFCRELELAPQMKKLNVTLPYWNWAADEANPMEAALWNMKAAQRIYIGGDGTGPAVVTGPFAVWTALVEDAVGNLEPSRGGIIRELTWGSPFPEFAAIDDAVPDHDGVRHVALENEQHE